MKTLILIAAGAALGLVGAADAKDFIGSNNQSPGSADLLVLFDFANPGAFVTIGEFLDGSGNPIDGIAGLDYNQDGSILYAADGYGTFGSTGGIYTVDPNTGVSNLLGVVTSGGLNDLAWDPVTGDLYGVDGANQLWANCDDPANAVNLGTLGIPGGLEVGLGFDSSGNMYVKDLVNDIIYTSNAGDLLNTTALHYLTYNANYSQGMHVDWRGNDVGYDGALNGTSLNTECYTFSTQGQPLAYDLVASVSAFTIEIGDLTAVIPSPGALMLLGLAGLVGRRRR